MVGHPMHPDLELILPAGDELGEGPIWDVDAQRLYWVDIDGKRYHTYDPATGAHAVVVVGELLGALALTRSGRLLLATDSGLSFFDPTQRSLTPIGNPEADRPGNRFNDGAVDRAGRFWSGTLGETRDNHLYRLDPGGSIKRMDSGIAISNGIAWSCDDRVMYFVDSLPAVIYAYDFDLASGEIANRRVFVNHADRRGLPDGLIVDAEGFVWTALWDGYGLERYDPDGRLERTLALPVQYPTSLAFGGPDLTELYITSALCEIPHAERAAAAPAGGLFRIRGAGRGLPEPRFAD